MPNERAELRKLQDGVRPKLSTQSYTCAANKRRHLTTRWDSVHRTNRILLPAFGSLLLLAACDQVGTTRPHAEDTKFELQKDQQGRVIRLDKVTGEIVIVNGDRLTPLKPVGSTQTSSSSNEPVATRTADRNEAPITRRQVSSAAPTRTSTPASTQVSSAAPPRTSDETSLPQGQTATVVTAATVFVTANRTQPTTVTLAAGSRVTILGADREWYRIEFDDARAGRRIGFVEKGSLSTAADNRTDLKSVDLSIPEAKPTEPLQPTDLSIRDRK
jgi:hypothetical protein